MIRHLHLAYTVDQFLRKMGQMYTGQVPLSGDCRSRVVRYLLNYQKQFGPDFQGQIYVYGFVGSKDVVHVLLTDSHGRIVADAYKGVLQGSVYSVDLPSGNNQTLDCIETVDTSKFFETYT